MGNEVNYNPDILSCLANLSNDEVFTPPELVNRILDMLPPELWSNPDTRVLDPCCKSGVFLREIAKRMLEGEKEAIPDLQKRIDHIFHNQLYGIAITELTSLLSRRSLYCSKFANGQYSVSHFDDTCGNIRYSNPKHSWDKDGNCIFCGASKSEYGRGEEVENYAYEFIHLTPKQIKELSDMHFDLIIGNPPYQLSDGGAQASSKPIYNLFVEQAIKLKPRYLTMIIPARWFSAGKGLDNFRMTMLHDSRIRILHDFPDASEVFPGLQIKAGVCYFLWERDSPGDCDVYTHMKGEIDGPRKRPLLEPGCESFIRYNKAIEILEKVRRFNEPSFMQLVSTRMPFGIPNTYKGEKRKTAKDDVELYISGNDREFRGKQVYAPLSKVTRNAELIGAHKVYLAYAGSGSDSFPHSILTKPFYGAPGTACTETYLVIGPFKSKEECLNVMSYISTKFFRFLVLQKKPTQHVTKSVHEFVPMQDFSKPWTDKELYAKYGITADEISFIDSMIKPMDISKEV